MVLARMHCITRQGLHRLSRLLWLQLSRLEPPLQPKPKPNGQYSLTLLELDKCAMSTLCILGYSALHTCEHWL